MRLVTADEMRYIDETAILDYGIREDHLMLRAGVSIADSLEFSFPSGNVAVFCGSGNNGGDGFVAAFELVVRGWNVTVFFDKNKAERLSRSSRHFYDLCQSQGIVTSIPQSLTGFDLVIDALLGTGFKGALRPAMAATIEMINRSGLPVVSADIPSGLPADGPFENTGLAVKASVTVTMGLAKMNCVTWPGKSFTGKLEIASIGFPKSLVDIRFPKNESYDTSLLDEYYLFHDDYDLNKTTAGQLLFIGGFPGYEGAAALSLGAFKACGFGMAYAFLPETSNYSSYSIPPEIILKRFESDHLSQDLASLVGKADVVLAGPGLGRSELAKKVIETLFDCVKHEKEKVVVLDADGLFFLNRKLAESCEATLVLTPHAGEAARLLGKRSADLDSDRPDSARTIAEKFGAIALFKGPTTVTSWQGRCIVNNSGGALLATAGSGDVLAGMIAAFLPRFSSPVDAVASAVYVHGRSADLYLKKGTHSFCASDILDGIRDVLAR